LRYKYKRKKKRNQSDTATAGKIELQKRFFFKLLKIIKKKKLFFSPKSLINVFTYQTKSKRKKKFNAKQI